MVNPTTVDGIKRGIYEQRRGRRDGRRDRKIEKKE